MPRFTGICVDARLRTESEPIIARRRERRVSSKVSADALERVAQRRSKQPIAIFILLAIFIHHVRVNNRTLYLRPEKRADQNECKVRSSDGPFPVCNDVTMNAIIQHQFVQYFLVLVLKSIIRAI